MYTIFKSILILLQKVVTNVVINCRGIVLNRLVPFNIIELEQVIVSHYS